MLEEVGSMRKRIVFVAAIALVWAGSLGCARHVVHHHPPATQHVTVLEKEHGNQKVVVVHARPGKKRHCWKHLAHWHCHR